MRANRRFREEPPSQIAYNITLECVDNGARWRPARRGLAATSAIASSLVLRPAKEASSGLISRESFVGRFVHDGDEPLTREECRKFALSAMPSSGRRRSGAWSHQHYPNSRVHAKPCRWRASTGGTPRPTSFSLNQTETPRDLKRIVSFCAAAGRPRRGRERHHEGQASCQVFIYCHGPV